MAGYIGSRAAVAISNAYTKAEADAGFVSDPNGAVTVDGSGNVGIGGAAPAWDILSPVVQVGNASISSYSSGNLHFSYFHNNMYYNGTNDIYKSTGEAALYQMVGGDHKWYSCPAGTGGTPATITERMRIDSAGRVTMPYQPSFTGTFVSTLNGSTIVFNSVGHNDGNMYNTSTGRFTAPVAGRYLYNAILLKAQNTTTGLQVIINGTSNHNKGQEKSLSSTAGYDHIVVQCIYKLEAGDWIDLNLLVGSLNSNVVSSDQYNALSIHLIG